jgi:hypothetical protein
MKFLQRTTLAIVALTLSAIYLYAWPAPNLFYAAVVLFHVGLGVLFCIAGLILLPRLRQQPLIVKLAAALLAIGAVIGLLLIMTGTARPYLKLLNSHIVVSGLAVTILAAYWFANRSRDRKTAWSAAVAIAIAAVVIASGSVYARRSWSKQYVIKNPSVAPLAMTDEGDGAQGSFFPSSAQVEGKRKIPAKYFMESDACERCHQDIYKQWQGSAHHFSTFNN